MTDEKRAIFGERLEKLRTQKGYNQTDFSVKIDIGRVTIAKYEAGERAPTIDHLLSFAEFFDVSTDYLLGISLDTTKDIDLLEVRNRTGIKVETVQSIMKAKDSVPTEIFDTFINNGHLYEILGHCNSTHATLQNATSLQFFMDVGKDTFDKFLLDKLLKSNILQITKEDIKDTCRNIEIKLGKIAINEATEEIHKFMQLLMNKEEFENNLEKVSNDLYLKYYSEEASDNGEHTTSEE